MKIYIKESSKAAINRGLAEGKEYSGENYSIFGDGGVYKLNDCEEGTTVAIFDKFSGGNPVAKSWGTWNGKKLV